MGSWHHSSERRLTSLPSDPSLSRYRIASRHSDAIDEHGERMRRRAMSRAGPQSWGMMDGRQQAELVRLAAEEEELVSLGVIRPCGESEQKQQQRREMAEERARRGGPPSTPPPPRDTRSHSHSASASFSFSAPSHAASFSPRPEPEPEPEPAEEDAGTSVSLADQCKLW